MLSTKEQKELFFYLIVSMAQRKIKTTLKKVSSSRRNEAVKRTELEQLSSEIFYEIFDYLTVNQIYTSFFGLNKRIVQLVYNTPNIYLDFIQRERNFYRHFQRIFCPQNIVSVNVSSDHVVLLQKLFGTTGGKRLKSISLDDVSLYNSYDILTSISDNCKDQLINFKVDFNQIQSANGTNQIREAFTYLLTELPLLKYLTLSGFNRMYLIDCLDPTINNNNIICLTLSVNDYGNWLSLLYRLPKLKSLTIYFKFENDKKRVASRDSTSHFGCQIPQNIPTDHRFSLRHVRIYRFNMILQNFENLFRLFVSPNLLTLSLFNCQRPFTRFPLPKRKPPFLDNIEWHNLIKTYLPSTMKRFYIEYEDVDSIMSMTNLTRIKQNFIKYCGEDTPWHVNCSYNSIMKFLSFDFNSISTK